MPLLPHHFGIFQLSVSNGKNSKVHLLWSDKYLSHYGNSYHLSTLPEFHPHSSPQCQKPNSSDKKSYLLQSKKSFLFILSFQPIDNSKPRFRTSPRFTNIASNPIVEGQFIGCGCIKLKVRLSK